jgi:leader peptidase (prepilin peptidase) / N-methyltransferase
MSRRIPCKTFDRTRHFIVDGLNWRGAARPYALVVWGLLAGLVWTVLDVSLLSPVPGLLLLKLSLLAILTVVAAIDARFGIIPDSLTVLLLITGAVNVLLESSHAPGTPTTTSAVLPSLTAELDAIFWRAMEALLAFLGAILFRACYRLLRSRDGLGLGDVKFVGAAALWVGLPMLPLMLMIAVSSAVGMVVLLRHQGDKLHGGDAIPFGPHLALGLWLTFLLGAEFST